MPADLHALSFQTVQVSPRWGTAVPLDEVVSAVAASGFRSVGLDHWSVETFVAAGGTLGEVADLLVERMLTCTDLCALVIGPDRANNLEQAHRLAALAVATGAERCATAVSDAVSAPHNASVIASLRECATVLNDAGVRLALEYLPYLPIRTVEAARVLCDSVGWDRMGLLVDSWATLVGGELDAVRALDSAEIALVQFADGVVPARGQDLADAGRNHRLVPGEGDLDLTGFVGAITASAYEGPVGVEVLSAAHRARPVADFANDVHAASRRLWRYSS